MLISVVLGISPELATCKASALSTVLSLQLHVLSIISQSKWCQTKRANIDSVRKWLRLEWRPRFDLIPSNDWSSKYHEYYDNRYNPKLFWSYLATFRGCSWQCSEYRMPDTKLGWASYKASTLSAVLLQNLSTFFEGRKEGLGHTQWCSDIILGCVQKLLLKGLRGHMGFWGTEPRSAMCKTKALPTVVSL